MAWNDNGVTVRRQLLDQQPTVASWGAAQIRLPTRALRTAGYLTRIRLWMAPTAFAGVVGTGTITTGTAINLSQWRALARFQLTLQGIAQLYDVRGEDLFFLAWLRNGRYNQPSYLAQLSPTATTSAPSNGGNPENNFLTNIQISSNNPTLGFYYDIPITEWVRFKDSVVSSQQGAIAVSDVERELGLITLQNTQSSVFPTVLLNPIYSTTPNAPVVVTGNATITAGSAPWQISADFYDVPDNPADRPSPMQQSFVITRQNVETPVTNGAATIQYRQAGLLLRVVYLCYDSSDNLVDVSSLAGSGTLDFKYGASVSKFTEYIQENLAKMVQRYYSIPPAGMLCHDMLTDDGTLIDPVDTANVINLRTEIKGFTGVATVRVIEERLIPVRAA